MQLNLSPPSTDRIAIIEPQNRRSTFLDNTKFTISEIRDAKYGKCSVRQAYDVPA